MSEHGQNQHADAHSLSCPSANERDPEAAIFGVVLGSADAPEIAYLERPVLLANAPAVPEDVSVTTIYRLAGTCVESKCQHFSGSHCRLGEHLTQNFEAVTRTLPPCSIRPTCRWFHEQRAQACLRCPQIVTEVTAVAHRASPNGGGKRQLPVV